MVFAPIIAPALAASNTGATVPNTAVENYLWGRHYWNKATFDDYRKSLGYFQKAVELAPSFGPAYAGIADNDAPQPSVKVALDIGRVPVHHLIRDENGEN